MCLAVPGQITSFDKSNPDLKMAKVYFNGVTKDVCVQWLPDVKIGDYVLVHVGFALNKIDEQDALETLQMLKDMGDIE
jgi:hydrogenase expression/formation protein HypC